MIWQPSFLVCVAVCKILKSNKYLLAASESWVSPKDFQSSLGGGTAFWILFFFPLPMFLCWVIPSSTYVQLKNDDRFTPWSLAKWSRRKSFCLESLPLQPPADLDPGHPVIQDVQFWCTLRGLHVTGGGPPDIYKWHLDPLAGCYLDSHAITHWSGLLTFSFSSKICISSFPICDPAVHNSDYIITR